MNEYFGWYDSYRPDLVRPPTTTAELGPYLDALHRANPSLPLVITEFGAEASRAGPVSQPGTYEFQTRYMIDHLRIHNSKRYVAGLDRVGAARLQGRARMARRRAARLRHASRGTTRASSRRRTC